MPQERVERAAWVGCLLPALRAERERLFPSSSGPRAAAPAVSGPLTNIRVFLSYAMPTNVQLARPLKHVLESAGAYVWFDQTERPDNDELAEGLHGIIADASVFLLCASNELFENAGYALQELAWVVDLIADGSWHGRICVASLDDVVLPRVVEAVPFVSLAGVATRDWAGLVVPLVSGAIGLPPSRLASATIPPPIDHYPELDLETLRLRRRHAVAWWAVSQLESAPLDTVRAAISRVGWDGRLVGYNEWPADPSVRDVRVRLGALATLSIITTGEMPGMDQDIAADIMFLAERRLPLLDEPPVAGWGDLERRYAVRHHLGAVTRFEEALRPGFAPPLVARFGDAMCDGWRRALRQRRLECVDMLLDLRRRGRIPWSRERGVGWDRACAKLWEFLGAGTAQWIPTPPHWVQLAIAGSRSDLSAVFADVAWRASATGATAARVFTGPEATRKVTFVVAASAGASTPSTLCAGTQWVIFLDATLRDGRAELVVRWREDAAAGAAMSSANGRDPLAL